jgi:malonyl CoA-acyl carrier protein transacylase
MIRDGVTVFVEFGAGEVLGGLVKRIAKGHGENALSVLTFAVFDSNSLANTSEHLLRLEVPA